jgi:AcrR family transcriptional regulator
VPRLADHDARRAEIVEALWRVLQQYGIHEVSVRSVAAEAGMSPTALRYYFPSQDTLIETAMAEMVTAASVDVLPRLESARDRAGVEAMLAAVLPIGPEGRRDQEIYLEFSSRSRTSPALAEISERTGAGFRRLARRAIEVLAASGELRPGLDPEPTAACLDAVIQGLIFQGCAHPSVTSAADMRRTLSAYLDQICQIGR